ncbi:hypothetical protein CE91St41_15380 [Oscillospiraceae bacterium]|nr:hypothetical protein CE91St40_22160 [Oscillospiraceae bacterium]BDF74649.1 hypothetical protein CE91St41_15380 [Oscillospiraceae bacterium]
MIDVTSLDFSSFDEVPESVRFYDHPKLSMTAQGVLSMNTALQTQAGKQRRFRIRFSKDGRYILLCSDAEGNICFSEKGVVTHRPMKELLLERGIQLPVSYRLEWCGGQNGWVGCSGDLPSPPPAGQLIQPQRRKGRKAE